MPWRVETPMSQRQDFVEAWARGHWHPTELCARVSSPIAQTGKGGLSGALTWELTTCRCHAYY